jgi:isopenicillin N synthase-like dioxygenase
MRSRPGFLTRPLTEPVESFYSRAIAEGIWRVDEAGLQPISMTLWQGDPPAFAAALRGAFEATGFAVVRGHGLGQGAIDAASASARAFFALPDGEKRRWRVPGQAGARGYTPFGVETAKGQRRPDLKEFWHLGRDLPEGHRYRRLMPENLWPARPEGFGDHLRALYGAFDALGRELLEAVALALELPRGWFADKTALGDSILRLAHYPPAPDGAAGVRAAAHEDINVITLLLGAEEPGLEILTRQGRWLAINPPPGCLVVNVGDMLQRLTNHVLPSTTHRVVNPPPERRGVARLSMPFFVHFEPEFEIRTLPSCVGPENADRYPRPITAHAYLQQRLEEIGLKRQPVA